MSIFFFKFFIWEFKQIVKITIQQTNVIYHDTLRIIKKTFYEFVNDESNFIKIDLMKWIHETFNKTTWTIQIKTRLYERNNALNKQSNQNYEIVNKTWQTTITRDNEIENKNKYNEIINRRQIRKFAKRQTIMKILFQLNISSRKIDISQINNFIVQQIAFIKDFMTILKNFSMSIIIIIEKFEYLMSKRLVIQIIKKKVKNHSMLKWHDDKITWKEKKLFNVQYSIN